MPKKTARKSAKGDILSREGAITDWSLQLYVHAVDAKGERTRKADTYLMVHGEFTEAIKGVSKFSVQLWEQEEPPVGRAEIASIGSITSAKLVLQAAAALSPSEYRTVLALATGNRLRYFSCSFQSLRYGSGLITGIGFDTELLQRD